MSERPIDEIISSSMVEWRGKFEALEKDRDCYKAALSELAVSVGWPRVVRPGLVSEHFTEFFKRHGIDPETLGDRDAKRYRKIQVEQGCVIAVWGDKRKY